MTLPEYFAKMRGTTQGSPPRVGNGEIFWSWLASFLGIAALVWIDRLFFEPHDLSLIMASFGASAVLIYGAVRSPLAQPRNLIGGHMLSAIVGVVCWKFLHDFPWLASALAVSTAIALMHATKTLHPPGGATALIAVIGSDKVHALGFMFVLIPATVGPLILLLVALLVNNISASRRYPEVWL
jgi:CBS-domain-containing membrane protein